MTASTLVLYDTTGPWGWLGELYATMSANLASHFGSWTAMPVASYQTGQLRQYTAAIYVGSTYDEPLPAAFLDDVYGTTTPVIWAYDNIWQLTNRYPNFYSVYGWSWSGFDTSSVAEVDYPLPPSTRATQQRTRDELSGDMRSWRVTASMHSSLVAIRTGHALRPTHSLSRPQHPNHGWEQAITSFKRILHRLWPLPKNRALRYPAPTTGRS